MKTQPSSPFVTRCHVACAIAVGCLLCGCGGEPKTSVDLQDPESVAAAFYRAYAAGRIEEAVAFVIPEEQAVARTVLSRASDQGQAEVPATLELRTELHGSRALVTLASDPKTGFKLLQRDARWWVKPIPAMEGTAKWLEKGTD